MLKKNADPAHQKQIIMKPYVMKHTLKNILLTLLSSFLIFSFTECKAQTKTNFMVSSVVPAARGSVSVKKDKYNNYLLRLDVSNLAEANRLTPPMKTYVVWIVTDENITKNVGQIKTTTTFLAKRLKATFETKSSFRPVKVYITAEYDSEIQSTDKEPILTTSTFNLPKTQ